MKRLAILAALLLGMVSLAQAQYRNLNFRSRYLGAYAGLPGTPTGLSYVNQLSHMDQLEINLGYDGFFNPQWTMPTVGDTPKQELVLQSQQKSMFQRGCMVLGASYQPYLQVGREDRCALRFYLSGALRARMHLERPTFQFNHDGWFITPEVAFGGGMALHAGPVVLFADGGGCYFNPTHSEDGEGGYALGPEARIGLRIRISQE